MRFKVCIWPSLIIATSSASASPLSASQDASESHPNPAIYRSKDVVMTMFEVFKPAHQVSIQRGDDPFQALPVVAFGHATDAVFEFLQTLPSRPFLALLEMVSEKVKSSWRRRIHHSRFVWMQLQSCLCSPLLQQFQGLPGFGFALTHNHQMVQRIQVDVGQQRTDDSSLRSSCFRFQFFAFTQHSLFEELADQLQNSSVGNLFLHSRCHLRVRDRVKVAFQIGIHDPGLPFVEQFFHSPQRIFASSLRSKTVAVLGKLPLEDRFDDLAQRCLHDAILYGRDTQRAHFSPSWLWNPHPFDGLWLVSPLLQALRQSLQILFQVLFVHLYRSVIYSRRSVIGFHLGECRRQIGGSVDLINQTKPFAPFDPFLKGRQHPCRPDRRFHPGPSQIYFYLGLGFFVLFSPPVGHSYRFVSCCLVVHVSTFLCSLRSDPVTGFHRYYGHSDSSGAGSSALARMNSVSLPPEVSLIPASALLDHSVPNHLIDPGRRFDTLPLSATDSRSFPVEASPLVGRLADLPGRIEFVILRTDRSPPAAPHPASRRRSCIQLQAGERMPEEDFHLSDQMRSQAHQPSLRD